MASTILDSVLELIAPLGCAACDAPSEGALFCGPCEATVAMHDRALGPYEYGGAVAEAIKRLKYQGRTDLGARLGEELAEAATRLGKRIDVVVPMPIHRLRRRERGFNQSALLARPIARRLGVPLDLARLRRVRPAPPQAELSQSERRRNLEGAFEARPDEARPHVLLVDDVCTTGTTLSVAEDALYEAGARVVERLVFAVAV
jgi:ComF family protein